MHWFELCENPEAMTLHYTDPPALDCVVIRELMAAGDSLRIYFDLNVPPNKPPACSPSAVVRLGLAFWSISNLELSGSPCESSASLDLSKLPDGPLRVELAADHSRLSAECKMAMIESFTVFTDEFVRRNTRTLFTYPNVWNSCLLTLRSEGFELDLVGEPGPDGESAHCQWHAQRGDIRLKASNPIELLGLAEIARRSPHDAARDYWWRIEGPDILSEMFTAWSAKWKGPLNK